MNGSAPEDIAIVSHRMLFDELCRRVHEGWIPDDKVYFAKLLNSLRSLHNQLVVEVEQQELIELAHKLLVLEIISS